MLLSSTELCGIFQLIVLVFYLIFTALLPSHRSHSADFDCSRQLFSANYLWLYATCPAGSDRQTELVTSCWIYCLVWKTLLLFREVICTAAHIHHKKNYIKTNSSNNSSNNNTITTSAAPASKTIQIMNTEIQKLHSAFPTHAKIVNTLVLIKLCYNHQYIILYLSLRLLHAICVIAMGIKECLAWLVLILGYLQSEGSGWNSTSPSAATLWIFLD